MNNPSVSSEEMLQKVLFAYLQHATSFDDCISVYREAPVGSDLETKALNKAYSLVPVSLE